MLKKRVVQLAVITTLGLSFAACERQDVTPATKMPGSLTASVGEESRDDLARIVASTLAANPDARALVKKMVLAKFDGDYDVLYRDIASQEVAGGTFSALLAEQYVKLAGSRGQEIGLDEAAKWVDMQTSSIPWCQLSMPVLCEEWDTDKLAPQVTALPAAFDDQTTETVLAYQGEGQEERSLLVKEEPVEAVVVIGPSERVDESGKPLYSVADGTAMRGNSDLLKKYQIADLGSIEPWILGSPELRMVTYKIIEPCFGCTPMTPPSTDQIHDMAWSPSRNTVKNQRWHDINSYLYAWGQNQATLGTRHRDLWFEQDPGPHIQLNLTITFAKGMKVTLNPQISSNDEQMGSSDIFFNDPVWPNAPYPYSTGSVSWFRSN